MHAYRAKDYADKVCWEGKSERLVGKWKSRENAPSLHVKNALWFVVRTCSEFRLLHGFSRLDEHQYKRMFRRHRVW